MRILVSFILFLSATLLFWVQPMFGKMGLPLLGGTPAVWNTCLVFFQAVLLLGYLYAHLLGVLLDVKEQIVFHLALMVLIFVFLPIRVPADWMPPTEGNPIPWLLLLLTVALGYPFLLLSSTAPLMQSWFSRSGDPRAADPYFLYAASNAGSLLGLLGYPLLVEPRLTLGQQTLAWSLFCVLLFLCMVVFGSALWSRVRQDRPVGEGATLIEDELPRLRWIVLAFVPSSLLQSVTTFMTTDLAAVPLLWAIPLALYIGSFVLVFTRRQPLNPSLMIRLQPLALIAVVVLYFWEPGETVYFLLVLNPAVLFLTSMVCHGELVRLRPSTSHLTEFYMLLSLGGVLGGIFNALLAPLVFNSVAEYPVTLIMAALVMPYVGTAPDSKSARALDYALPALLLFFLCGGLFVAERWVGVSLGALERAMVGTTAGIVTLIFSRRPVRYGLGLSALLCGGLVASFLQVSARTETVHQQRNFFGIVKVERNSVSNKTSLIHNTTLHGVQIHRPEFRNVPLSYFSRGSPVGDVFRCVVPKHQGRKVGIVGLGSGTMASYARPEDKWTFYEINPEMVRVALKREYFTYVPDCPAQCEIVLGDARLSVAKAPNGSFNLFAVDAFSSDAIPVHLVTVDALRLYLSKLALDGLMLFHITNSHFDLAALFRNLAQELDLVGLARYHEAATKYEIKNSITSSYWVVLARSAKDLACIEKTGDWKPLDEVTSPRAATRPWTDDYSNLLERLRILQ